MPFAGAFHAGVEARAVAWTGDSWFCGLSSVDHVALPLGAWARVELWRDRIQADVEAESCKSRVLHAALL